jgi:hypothetical protein
MNKKKSIELNSAKIISIRKDLDTNINKYWHIIRAENVMAKKAINAGIGSGYDLKSLYNEITQMSNKRIMIKGMLMYLNMGITTFNFDEFKKTNNYSIFAAGEYKEIIAQLKMIPTINPTEKATKGKKNISKSETFTSAKIASLLKDIQLKANKYDAELKKFNDNTNIIISDDIADSFNSYLTI